MKELVRQIVWAFGALTNSDGEIRCEPGTMKFRLCVWLYGEPEQERY